MRTMSKAAAVSAALVCCSLSASPALAVSKPLPPGKRVSLEWVGDIALSSQRGLPPQGVPAALAPVRALLQDADVTVGNLEGTLSVGGISKCGRIGSTNCFAFQAPPIVAGQLHGIGFDVLGDYDTENPKTGRGLEQRIVSWIPANHIFTGISRFDRA